MAYRIYLKQINFPKFILVGFLFLIHSIHAQLNFPTNTYDPIIDSILKSDSFFKPYIDRKEHFRIQILYTQIDRDKNQIPVFTHRAWRYLPNEYFNPASFVKVPTAIIALEKLSQMKKIYPWISKTTKLTYDKSIECHKIFIEDTNSIEKHASIGNYIKRAFLVSENEPYTRLYEFCGQKHLNEMLQKHGWYGSKIIQRFASSCDEEGNKNTPAVNFFINDSTIGYTQTSEYNEHYIHDTIPILIGNYVKDGKKLIKGGKDYSNANRIFLSHIHEAIWAVCFHEYVKKFSFSQEDADFLKTYLGMHPFESLKPNYNYSKTKYWNTYVNYFIYGQSKTPIDTTIRIYNTVAMVSGFVGESAYIVDKKNKREFILSAIIYVNEDGILMDDTYNYADLGMPFLKQLGITFLAYEKSRKLKTEPIFN